jgi:hypothetical protein
MKKPRKKPAKATAAFKPGEHIRVVPLHHPKPSIDIADLSRRGAAAEEGDLFDGQPHPAPASAHLSYNGGPLICNVQVYTIFWGKLWGTTPTSQQMLKQLNQFFAAILVSPLIDQLAEYNVPKQSIGHGTLLGSRTISANAPAGSITDSAIQSQLQKWIKARTVPAATKNTLYFIYLDPAVSVIMGGSKSCQSFCGYHNNARSVYYAVMPYPTCSGCLGGLSAIDALTGTSSHELCEAITDPIPGKGWYDNTNGEIGDICAWNFKQVAGYNVQLEWSNQQNKCV